MKISLLLLFTISLSAFAGPKLLNQFDDVMSAVKDLNSQPYACEEVSSNDCPNVHVTPWCKRQYELLKNTRPISEPSFAKGKTKRILFLGEEHGDEQAYSYYEKLLNDKSAGFDCLFLEFPTVFQKNFDNKSGIVHDRGVFTDLNKVKDPQNFSQVKLLDFNYLELLESLVEVARKNKVKVILVDSSLKTNEDMTLPSEVMRRNTSMAQNIQKAFSSHQCSNGLSIQGNMHLFTRAKDKLTPIDQIMKENNLKLPADQRIEIKKGMIYSAGSETLAEAMGPCSWINALPRDKEIFYEGPQYNAKNELFPENIQKALTSKFGEVENNVDYVIFLPMQMDKAYALKKLNKYLKAEVPKKFLSKSELSIEAKNVPLSLRTNPTTLNISDAQSGLMSKCSQTCQNWNFKLVLKDILLNEPVINCKSFHPSRTNGAVSAPILELNQTIVGDCYCLKK